MSATTANLFEFRIGGRLVPGVIEDIQVDGRSMKWDVQQAVGTSGGITIYRGSGPIESIKIMVALLDENGENTDAVESEWLSLLDMMIPKAGVRPPSFEPTNYFMTMVKPPVTKVAHKSHTVPKIDQKRIPRVVLELIEPRPRKPAPASPPKPAQLDNADISPADAREIEIAELMTKAQQIP